MTDTLKQWLTTAAGWRYGALLFQAPTPATQQDLRALAAEVPASLDEWPAFPELEAEFHRVLGPGGVACIESSYEENALAGRGPLLAEIAGFYEAFAYRPETETRETPDHLAIELGFLSYLALKVAYALHEARTDERQIAEAAYWRFLEVHPLYWLGRFCERVALTGSPVYGVAAQWLVDWVDSQVAQPGDAVQEAVAT